MLATATTFSVIDRGRKNNTYQLKKHFSSQKLCNFTGIVATARLVRDMVWHRVDLNLQLLRS